MDKLYANDLNSIYGKDKRIFGDNNLNHGDLNISGRDHGTPGAK